MYQIALSEIACSFSPFKGISVYPMNSYFCTKLRQDCPEQCVQCFRQVSHHVIQAMSTYPKTTFECTIHEPQNKNLQPQRPFYSTKKKRLPSTIKLAKPTEEEKKKICDALMTNHNLYPLLQERVSDLVLRRIIREF